LLNPLADPFTLGVASGAAFGASLALSLGVGTALWGSLGLVPFSALVGAVAALGLVLALGAVAGGFHHGTLILAGVIVSAFLSSLISLMKFLFADSLSAIVFWIMGSFSARTWSHLWFALPYILAGTVILAFYARELNLLALGDAPAQQLGLAGVGHHRLCGAHCAASGTAAGGAGPPAAPARVGLGRRRPAHRRRHPGPGPDALRPGLSFVICSK